MTNNILILRKINQFSIELTNHFISQGAPNNNVPSGGSILPTAVEVGNNDPPVEGVDNLAAELKD